MIQTIVFDMGGVLIRWNPGEYFGLTAEEKAVLMPELFQSEEWVEIDHGMLTPEEAVEKVCARVAEQFHASVRHYVLSWFDHYLIPMPGMAELVRELKANGYRILLLSNAGTSLRTYFPRIPGSEVFDGLMVSAEERLLKPQREIYERLCERFDLDPAECIFIDDNPANVEGSKAVGMAGLVFCGDVPELRRNLCASGVKCNG